MTTTRVRTTTIRVRTTTTSRTSKARGESSHGRRAKLGARGAFCAPSLSPKEDILARAVLAPVVPAAHELRLHHDPGGDEPGIDESARERLKGEGQNNQRRADEARQDDDRPVH